MVLRGRGQRTLSWELFSLCKKIVTKTLIKIISFKNYVVFYAFYVAFYALYVEILPYQFNWTQQTFHTWI